MLPRSGACLNDCKADLESGALHIQCRDACSQRVRHSRHKQVAKTAPNAEGPLMHTTLVHALHFTTIALESRPLQPTCHQTLCKTTNPARAHTLLPRLLFVWKRRIFCLGISTNNSVADTHSAVSAAGRHWAVQQPRGGKDSPATCVAK